MWSAEGEKTWEQNLGLGLFDGELCGQYRGEVGQVPLGGLGVLDQTGGRRMCQAR